MQIPLIDLAPLYKAHRTHQALSMQDEGVRKTVEQLSHALRNIGFLYIKNHGIPKELQGALEQKSRAFFSKPSEEKQSIRMENAGLHWKGYFSVGAELTMGRPDRKEGLYFGTELDKDDPAVLQKLPMHGPNQWPLDDDGSFRQTVLDYMEELTQVSHILMEAVALGLGLENDYFSRRFTHDPTRLFRIFHYPRHTWAEDEDEWGVREHTDMGFLTILLQDQSGGLQVKARDGEWWDAPPIEDTFVVNIGDMLELWTWGILKANPHRVKNPSSEGRLSFPFFFDPCWHASLERIERASLDPALLETAHSSAEERWDGLDLSRISKETTYGEFVWSKVSKVFPQLVPKD